MLKLVRKQNKTDRSKLGRRSKTKGANYERKIAKRFEEWTGVEWVRVPMSGGFHKNKQTADDFRGDIVPASRQRRSRIHIEAKDQKTWSLPSWLRQAQADTAQNGRIPLVVFHRHGTSEDYICLKLEDFCTLVSLNTIWEDAVI
jgi:Holliday junction resolvase